MSKAQPEANGVHFEGDPAISHMENDGREPLCVSIGAEEESNGFRVETEGGQFLGWVYPMDYIEGREGTWGAISDAPGDTTDPTLYREGFASDLDAASWLFERWMQV